MKCNKLKTFLLSAFTLFAIPRRRTSGSRRTAKPELAGTVLFPTYSVRAYHSSEKGTHATKRIIPYIKSLRQRAVRSFIQRPTDPFPMKNVALLFVSSI